MPDFRMDEVTRLEATAHYASEKSLIVNAGHGLNYTNVRLIATVAVGAHPLNVAITHDGASAYVADAGANSVTVINTASNKVLTALGVGTIPVDVSISPNGARAYITNAGSRASR